MRCCSLERMMFGGLLSAVCAAVPHKALLQSDDSSRVQAIHIDNGFLRKDQSEQVVTSLHQLRLNLQDVAAFIPCFSCYQQCICLKLEPLSEAEKLDGVYCFKGFFVKKIAGFALSAAEPVACIPAINVLSSLNHRVFVYYVLLTISLQHPMYPDSEASLLSQPSSIHFSSLLCLPNANRNKGSSPLMPYHEIENVIVNPAAKSSFRTSHAVLDFSWNFLATSTQA
ncbi:hypothetical protein OUZ56_022022 [Daphnia magna]|uniref:Uncharacterized protein n=1 Tax=Daphnia magna TaxID=35525 RepID=A0ABR0AV44_9CRUS|nr:hypothetical protein OUZ56_022022 [Daphnia magna]